MLRRLWTVLRHAWWDGGDTHRVFGPAAQDKVARAIATAEQGHSGEIRVMVESTLPGSYLWRHVRDATPLPEIAHQRALMQFAKLGVWDTAHNNGVLVYVLLAEHHIEVVADRAVHARVGEAAWRAAVQQMGADFAAGHFEQGLEAAVQAIAGHLRAHFPLADGAADSNELDDAPVLR